MGLDGDLDGVDFGAAASLGIQKDGLGGHGERDGVCDFFEEVVGEDDRGLPGLFSAGILGTGVFGGILIFHE